MPGLVPGSHVFPEVFISRTRMGTTSPVFPIASFPAGECWAERNRVLEKGVIFGSHPRLRMPIINRVADLQPDIQAWRRDIHQHPELLYDVHRTAAFVADRLREFGCDEVATGLGRTGVVGVIKGRKPAGKGDHQGDRVARRYGRAADRGRDQPALCLEEPRPDARLRP